MGENSPQLPTIERRDLRRVSYLRCLSTPTRLTLSRNSSLRFDSLHRPNSGCLSVQAWDATSTGGECTVCAHRERPALLDNPTTPKQPEEVKLPFQEHPSLSPCTSVCTDRDSECIVCFEKRDTIHMTHPSCILMPCQHHQLCFECANRMEMCPLCRGEIDRVVRSDTNILDSDSISSEEKKEMYKRRCLNAIIFTLILTLGPAMFLTFHFFVWPSWGIVKILVGVMVSGLVVGITSLVAQRIFLNIMKRRAPREDEPV